MVRAATVVRRFLARQYTPAEAVAINLLVEDPDLTMADAIRLVKDFPGELYDEVSGDMVAPGKVLEALQKMVPKPLPSGGIKVYHATSKATAEMLLKRGFIPETKPRPRSDDFGYAPGRGVDQGLYVGASPQAVNSYGPVTLEVSVPKKYLEVPTELAQHGEKNPLKALKSHDGAVINERLPPKAFRLLPKELQARVIRRAYAETEDEFVTVRVVTRGEGEKAIKDIYDYLRNTEGKSYERVRVFCESDKNLISAMRHVDVSDFSQKPIPSDERYPETETTFKVEDIGNDGLLRLILFLKWMGSAGSSREVLVQGPKDKKPVHLTSFDGDGSDGIMKLEVNGEAIEIGDGHGFNGLT